MPNRGWESESVARDAMLFAEDRRDYELAAVAAVGYADYVGTRSPEGALNINLRALVYATLARTTNGLTLYDW